MGPAPITGNEVTPVSIGHRDYDFLEWMSRSIPPPPSDSAWFAARRKSWARLIRRVYEVDPLLCRCGERTSLIHPSRTDLSLRIMPLTPPHL